jgi:uncharacterized protein
VFYFWELPVSVPVTVKIGGTEVLIEIASTDEERVRGLSGRQTLDSNSGMLFVFEKTDFHGIWMKDMNFNLDIIWIDEYLRVVDTLNDVSRETYPEVFEPSRPSKYVLELSAGFLSRYPVDIGEKVSFSY